ncbi:MAG: ComE operon protein 3 [Fimbriimonadaceae bacterium]|nr:ComE operon protein 3 [Fimbriimonadaceae bacterium]
MLDLRRGLIVTLALSLFAFASHYWPAGNKSRIVFLQVGQGDCILIQSEGRNLLIDAGPRTERFDTGSRIIARELRRFGVRAVDLVLISHPDLDHIGGLRGLSRRMPIREVVIAEPFIPHSETRFTVSQSWLPPKSVRGQSRGRLVFGRFAVEWLTPSWSVGRTDNDGSMFVRITDGIGTAVFSGDASSIVEEELISALDWKADVLKAGHHGSGSSTGQRWLMRTQPKWVVMSCGRHNRYGHPHPDVLERVRSVGGKPLRTDQLGSLIFEPSPTGFTFAGSIKAGY